MIIKKKIIGHLNKCYSLAPLTWKNKQYFLTAAEKQDPCFLYDLDGTKVDTVWEGPGGVMTMQQIPGTDGEFLATQKFYSPNDSAEAYLVHVKKGIDKWEIKKIADAPFVHRFGILESNSKNYLIVCTLKSDHHYKNDWDHPGAIYVAELPEDPNQTIELKLLKDGLLKNHGFSIYGCQAVIGTENGTFLIAPPTENNEEWTVELLLDVPSSDSVLIDLDGDGLPELGTIAPFHGNSITIWHLDEHQNYVPQWKYPAPEKDTEMVHATWAGTLCGTPAWVVGWRKGTRETIAITWDKESDTYKTQTIDQNTGAANLMHLKLNEKEEAMVAANREIDEIAMYICTHE